jgi:hypothetical protein
MGLLGMTLGAIGGVRGFDLHPVLAVYAGAALGWIAGFIFAFLIVLTAEKDTPDHVRCSLCKNVFPAGTETCLFCGSRLTGTNVPALTRSCVKVAPYALSNPFSVYWLSMLSVGGYLLVAVADYLVQEFPAEVGPWKIPMYGTCGLVWVIIAAVWMEFFLRAISATLVEHDRVPNISEALGFQNIPRGLRGLLAVVVCVVPVITFPLLPLVFISLCLIRGSGAFNLFRAVRIAWGGAKNYANLWLLMLMWAAGGGLGIAVIRMLFGLMENSLPPMEGVSGILLSKIVSVFEIGIDSALICIFGLAVCQCMGLFGRQNMQLFRREKTYESKPMIGGAN